MVEHIEQATTESFIFAQALAKLAEVRRRARLACHVVGICYILTVLSKT